MEDDSGFVHVKWFQFNETYITEKIKAGRKLIFSGKPTHNKRGGGLEVIHPNTEIQSDEKFRVARNRSYRSCLSFDGRPAPEVFTDNHKKRS